MNFLAFNSVIITLNEYSFAEVCNSSTTRQIRLPKLRYVNVSKELTFLFKEENAHARPAHDLKNMKCFASNQH